MPVHLDVSDFVAVVRLDRPPVNALDRATRAELIATFDAISDRDDIRVAVLTGTGSMFCSGADLRDRPDKTKPGDFLAHNRATRETGNAIRECTKPVIAAVNGPALGAGFGLMAACDIYFASDKAVFGMPEINVGLAGGIAMLRTLLGHSLTRRMVSTGLRLSAAELYRLGVMEAVLPPEQLLPEALAVAHEIASRSGADIVAAKHMANLIDVMPQREGYGLGVTAPPPAR
jgi:enoyl-CoA hydratase